MSSFFTRNNTYSYSTIDDANDIFLGWGYIPNQEIESLMEDIFTEIETFQEENNLPDIDSKNMTNQETLKWNEWMCSDIGIIYEKILPFYNVMMRCGEDAIGEYEFVDYVQEYFEEFMTNDLPPIIKNHIDWEAIAEECKVDFMEESLGDSVYYIRG